MPWIQIRINATAKTADKVSNMLLGRGAQAVTFMDAKDVPVYEPMPGETPLWGETEVMGLFDAETDPAPTIAFFQQIFGEDVGYKVEQLEDKDWVREWMDHFHPMQFGERLWICPSWRDVPNPDAVNVMLDPGLAFGTGTHPTTALCLQWLDGLDLAGKTVVDFGCGSGILGIAALKLGAARVIGIDIDPQAIQASRDNAMRNGVADQIELYLPADQPQDVEADVVVANILAGPLRELAPLIAGHGKAGSLMALSGVLESQAPELETIYGQWFEMDPTAVKEEWCRLSGRKLG
ncbi:50S ribosomal protein L11 methyltransferase [Aeromonas dhakensis]|jgi:ribosomal protein L11 methyltransferase|uniref:Ribosomal protein L11 methyltransferase n=3 Tax=Aeromonas TaxID=642 RepID=A0AAD3U8V6_AERHY|nr:MULTISPECIES: 50S ribosomal protein L11 methyltransferase [Aeromonas]AGM45350.1 ribosomal protein L11 methyltransferase [Aeromonas hydrophila ML09-119]AHX33974.1 ribosomal protein L11 methyltransferase [Aeromonas hydrophila subsp. hydrophila AL09-71]AHX70775.1 ribosomal protein L11 methyltransferase [Aeromonas hydrophila pc104A]AJE35246.1 ribosomal protein L11 methyltransferase [Aeromonas hydrophila J-1]AKJ33442.1 ribosomal protein L11 methyltransferase [Aeromonas hydrophila NJ-35]